MTRQGKHIASIAFFSLVLCSCGGRSSKKADVTVPFPMPQVPSVIDDSQKMEYVAAHFWDALTNPTREYVCADSSIVSGVKLQDIEQAVANYVMLCGNLPIEKAQRCISAMALRLCECEKANVSSNVFEVVGSRMERYLYDPNSPLRDEDLYRPYASAMASSGLFDETKSTSYAEDARLCSLNCRGSVAADFRYTDRKGRTGSLHKVKAEYVILFFSNPGCHACKDIIDALSKDEKIAALVAQGRVAVLNIYIDEDLGEWYKYMPIYPDEWTNAYDPDHIIRDDELYSVRAIPSLYLLDGQKRVLLKDATTEKLMAYIYETVS